MVKKFILAIFFILGSISIAHSSCSDAESEAYDGYRDAKKAYGSSDLSSCQRYARKAYRHASYAEEAASGCNN